MKQLRFLVILVAVGTMLSGCRLWPKGDPTGLVPWPFSQTPQTYPHITAHSAVSAGAGGGMQGGQVVAPPPHLATGN